jgi:hypothetical protein
VSKWGAKWDLRVYLTCRDKGHDWKRLAYGDPSRHGTHKCVRCGKWGFGGAQ